jgi:hypothetical protein
VQELKQDLEIFKAIMNHIDPENKIYNRRKVIKKVKEMAGKHSNCLISKVYNEFKSTRLE